MKLHALILITTLIMPAFIYAMGDDDSTKKTFVSKEEDGYLYTRLKYAYEADGRAAQARAREEDERAAQARARENHSYTSRIAQVAACCCVSYFIASHCVEKCCPLQNN